MGKDLILSRISNYDLHFKIEPVNNFFNVNGLITICNDGSIGLNELNLILYHSLNVKSIKNAENTELFFTQNIISLKDKENYYINYITVYLDKILEPNGQVSVNIEYEGNIYGYSHLMAYIKDKIDKDFSILRPDSHTYPIVANPYYDSILKSYKNTFTYNLSIDVPKEYAAGCGGILKKFEQKKERNIFYYTSYLPTWRFDIGVAQYSIVEDKDMKLRMFVFPEHVTNAEVIVKKEIRRAVDLYSNLFGECQKDNYFTVVEVKEFYGSQAGDNYILMEEHGFSSDRENYTHLYHEIGHSWNVKAKNDVQRTRFFDEAFACYFEAIAIKKFYGHNAFIEKMESYRKSYVESIEADEINFYTPICDYWKYDIGYNSYTKGPWVLYVLNEILGDDIFNKVIKSFLNKFKNKQVDFKNFEETVHEISGVNLNSFFKQWIYGIESSEFLYKELDLSHMINKSKCS